jgi:segregation and condensation protein B
VENTVMGPGQLDRLLEALLFVADGPIAASQLAQVLQLDEAEIVAGLSRLQQAHLERGVRLQEDKGRYQLVTAPEAAPYVEKLLGLDLSAKLSRAALETLAVIAYRQPVTRAQVEAVRGVDCDGVIRTLLAKGLVCDLGRLEQAGRPILLGTTPDFLQYFGLQGLAELPPLEPKIA